VVKPTLQNGFDYKKVQWADQVGMEPPTMDVINVPMVPATAARKHTAAAA
jgi:hypothetical protein